MFFRKLKIIHQIKFCHFSFEKINRIKQNKIKQNKTKIIVKTLFDIDFNALQQRILIYILYVERPMGTGYTNLLDKKLGQYIDQFVPLFKFIGPNLFSFFHIIKFLSFVVHDFGLHFMLGKFMTQKSSIINIFKKTKIFQQKISFALCK